MENNLGKIGFVGRFRPLHNGAAALLESLCEKATHVIIGVGSSNKYNVRNPFTAKETKDMIDAFLSDRFNNYEIIQIPDFAHIPGNEDGQKWRKYVLGTFKELDYFVSGNDFVRRLLQDDYEIIHPGNIVPKEKHVFLRGTRVRYEMAKCGKWEKFVPKKVSQYIKAKQLDERFRREFGLQSIASAVEHDYNQNESALQEKLHAQEN